MEAPNGPGPKGGRRLVPGSVQTHCGPVSGGIHVESPDGLKEGPRKARIIPVILHPQSGLCGCTALLSLPDHQPHLVLPSPRNSERAGRLGEGGILRAMGQGIPAGQRGDCLV